MSIKNLNFLGNGHAALSLLLENLSSTLPIHFLNINIISNLPPDPDNEKIPFIPNKRYMTIRFYQQEIPPKITSDAKYLIGASQPKAKKQIVSYFKIQPQQFFNLIPTTATIASSTELGYGLQLNPGVVIASYAQLGNFVSINRNATIGHHTVIEDYVTINPGANIAGFCQIGEGTIIGMGANIIEKIKIGKNVIVGAGAVVTKDVPDQVLVMGIPARIMRRIGIQSKSVEDVV